MDYFYLKRGLGNALAKDWVAGGNPFKSPAASFFRDNLTKDDCAAAKGGKEPREFVRRGNAPYRGRTFIVVIHDGEIWLLKPTVAVRFLPSVHNENEQPHNSKAMPVDEVARRPCRKVPRILASVGANRYCASGRLHSLNGWRPLNPITPFHVWSESQFVLMKP